MEKNTNKIIDPDSGNARRYYHSSELPFDPQSEMEADYIARTVRLVEKITRNQPDQYDPQNTFVFFLDKSARPVSWIMSKIWGSVALDAYNNPLKMPHRKFINVDRLPWRIDKNISIANNPDNLRTPGANEIQAIRDIFNVPNFNPADHAEPRIIIVDEISDTGDTLYVASKLLGQAYPEAKIEGFAWMNSYKGDGDNKQVLNVPTWYSQYTELGRGVFGALEHDHPMANWQRKKPGTPEVRKVPPEAHQFLSTRNPELQKDRLTKNLRDEIKAMGQKFRELNYNHDTERVPPVMNHVDQEKLDKLQGIQAPIINGDNKE